MLVALIGATASAGGCSAEDEAKAAQAERPREAAVSVAAAAERDVEVTRRAVGTVRAVDAVDVTPEVAGLIAEVRFAESMPVNRGDVLVTLDSEQAEAQLRAAEARRDRVAREAEQIEQLFRQGAATEKEQQDIGTELVEADAAVRLAQIVLDDHTVRAPFAGEVGLREVSVGAYVEPGDLLTSLQSVDPIEARFALPEADLGRVAPGQRIDAIAAAYPGRRFTGEVIAVDARVDPATRTVTVAARLPNPDGALRPGMFVDVTLVAEVRRGAVVAPETAVLQQGEQAVVFVVEGGKAARRNVTLGQRQGGLVEVREGLAAGAVVVTSDQGNLRDGAAVKPTVDATLAALGIDPAPFVGGLPAEMREPPAAREPVPATSH